MEVFSSVDTIWVLLGAALVFFMQAGFAMVETGLTRAKNAGNIIMKNVMDFCCGTIVYWIFGFGLMFGASIYGFIGGAICSFRVIIRPPFPPKRLSFSKPCSAQQRQPSFRAPWRSVQNSRHICCILS